MSHYASFYSKQNELLINLIKDIKTCYWFFGLALFYFIFRDRVLGAADP